MNFRQLARARAGRVLYGVILCGTAFGTAAACKAKAKAGEPALALGGESIGRSAPKVDEAVAARRAKLAAAPLGELDFVPADAEAIVRVDLAALAARDAHAAHALDYLLRAQQPAAWEFLANAGISSGKELRAIYLVVGAPGAAGVAAAPTFAVAGVGDIDVARVAAALRRGGAIVEPAPGGGALFTWKDSRGADAKAGASIPPEKGWGKIGVDVHIGETAIGVSAGLLLVGHPALVRAALRAHAGEGKDLRTTDVADELLALDATAVTWGVARAAGTPSYLDSVAPGLRRARFHAALSGIGKGTVEIRAEFASAAEAETFRGVLDQFLADTAKLTGDTPVGKSLAHLRAGAKITVAGSVLTVYALL